MSRLTSLFEQLKIKKRKALVPYIVAGDPEPAMTVPLMHELVKQGADIIEIGVPFSDPMAEGPIIQLAHERALAHNVSLTDILEMVTEFRKTDSDTALVLMGYANPVEHMGYEAFAQRAEQAGIDGLLTVDLPPEEAEQQTKIFARHGIDTIFLMAPTTSEQRIKKIASLASGYLYYVSLKGVTGAGNLDVQSVREKLALIKQNTDLPVTVGFGIKDGDSAALLAPLCEGVVVGSALIEQMVAANAASNDTNKISQSVAMIGEIRRAIDNI